MKITNWWVLVAGFLYVGASVCYFYMGWWKMGIAFIAYAIANFCYACLNENQL